MSGVSLVPPDQRGEAVEEEITYCYGHPDTPTRLHCTRCDKPICGRCAVPASVGQHCVWCVAEARKSAPKVRSTMQATSPAVLAIIGINVAIYILEALFPQIILWFAARPPLIAAGEWYRLLTPMFLHAPLGTRFGIFHILMNMYILRIYGPPVEQFFGSARFVLMYLTAGFLGGAASYAFGSCATIGVGASGAIFGVVGMLLVHLYRRRTSAFVSAYMKNLLFFLGINLVFGFAVAGIDNLAHLGGLASGIALAAGMESAAQRDASPPRQIATMAAVIAVGLALVVWRTATMPPGCIAFL